MDEEQDHETPALAPGIEPRKPFTIPKNIVYVGIFVILIIMGLTIVIAKLINENSQCTSNPFVYGASRIEKVGDPVSTFCSCVIEGGGTFWFDEEKTYTENPLFSGVTKLELNAP